MATALAAPGELDLVAADPVAVPEVCDPVGAEVAEESGGRVEAAEASEAEMALLALHEEVPNQQCSENLYLHACITIEKVKNKMEKV